MATLTLGGDGVYALAGTRGTYSSLGTGTSVELTNIRSDAEKITVYFRDMSTDGSNFSQIQLGDSGGYVTSGYEGIGSRHVLGNTAAFQDAWSAGILLNTGGSTGRILHGRVSIHLIDPATDLWDAYVMIREGSGDSLAHGYGQVTLNGTLDRLRIVANSGLTENFDAGSWMARVE